MTPFARSNGGPVSRWFWTVDRLLLTMLLLLIAVGLVFVLVASGPQAQRLAHSRHATLSPLHFFNRQLIFAVLGMILMIGVSFLSRITVRRLCAVALPIVLMATFATLFLGADTKGATRWIPIFGVDLQPSEFLKPCLAVVTAWILAARYDDPNAPVYTVSFGLTTIVAIVLIKQPDFGQTALVLTIWLAQAVIAGLPLATVGIAAGGGFAGLVISYFTVPHVAHRINGFLSPSSTDTYQVSKALEAFRTGGLMGVGPAEGEVKWLIPDAHTDYIFAVAGEEFGLLACSALALLYLAIVLRSAKQQLDEDDPFVFLATVGLVVQFGVQAFINMGVNVALLPSKGMTLPFVSYGGSSMLAMALTMGMVLALSRRNRFMRGRIAGHKPGGMNSVRVDRRSMDR